MHQPFGKKNAETIGPLLVRADGGSKRGLGHLFRVLELMRYLRRRWRIHSVLAVKSDPVAVRLIRRAGVNFWRIPRNASLREQGLRLNRLGAAFGARMLLLDVLDTKPEQIRILRRQFRPIVTLDDRGDGAALCDAVIHMLTRPRRVRTVRARVYAGPRWVILRREFLARRRRAIVPVARQFVISIGGADPGGLSLKVARALLSMDLRPRVTLILGPAFCHRRAAEKLVRSAGNRLRLVPSPVRLAAHLARADIAVVSGGMTAYESAALGVPTVAVCQTKAEWSNNSLRDHPFVVSLGIGRKLTIGQIQKELRSLALDQTRRRTLRRKALRAMDGRGLERVGRVIADCYRRAVE